MTSGHLVTDGNLSLLGNVDFCKLHHAVGKFVTDLDLVESSLVGCCCLFVSDAVVVDEITDHSVGLFVIRPLVGVDIVEIRDTPEHCGSDFLTFRYNLHAIQVADSGALLAVGKNNKFLEELGVQ